MQTYFEHYVLGGGWAMLLLLPGSMITLAVMLRGWLALRSSSLTRAADSPATRIGARLALLSERFGHLTMEDVRAEVDAEVNDLRAIFQPLLAALVIAPLIGVLGSLTAIMSANAAAAAGSGAEALAARVEQALVPSMWGTGIALAAALGLFMLNVRLYRSARQVLEPAAEASARDLLRLGERPGASRIPAMRASMREDETRDGDRGDG